MRPASDVPEPVAAEKSPQRAANGRFAAASQPPSNYLRSLLDKSSGFIHSLRSQYNLGQCDSLAGMQPAPKEAPQVAASFRLRSVSERQASQGSQGSQDSSRSLPNARPALQTMATKPPLPPPPPRALVEALTRPARLAGLQESQQEPAGGVIPTTRMAATAPTTPAPICTSASVSQVGRRHALIEQSLERDAALSLKAANKQHKHKHRRAASIKSALKHANLGTLKLASGALAGVASQPGGSQPSSGLQSQQASKPYELFEPPITQRSLQRSRRRGAMLSATGGPDANRRQHSADMIGLRQLTDEYLANAGLGSLDVPLTSGSRTSGTGLVALRPGPAPAGLPGEPAGSLAAQSQGRQLEARLYQASRQISGPKSSSSLSLTCLGATVASSQVGHPQASGSASHQSSGSSSSLETGPGLSATDRVTVLPGHLPWQSDVSIQCELLAAPPLFEPFETTGDILNTIAGPFPAGQSAGGVTIMPAGQHSHLSATLKKGLTHLAPSTAVPAAVVGSLKKSLSNTIEISQRVCLHSQDSLPAYTSLTNEAAGPAEPAPVGANPEQTGSSGQLEAGQSGLIGQIASKLARQSSKKAFAASKHGLHRALSFDCRGYKRLEASSGRREAHQEGAKQAPQKQKTASNLLEPSGLQRRAHNRSTLALTDLPRPYLPQSASQVDFQLPLLPYERMQEALVSQRLIEPASGRLLAEPPSSSLPEVNKVGGAPGLSPTSQVSSVTQSASGQHPDADELLCAPSGTSQSRGLEAASDSRPSLNLTKEMAGQEAASDANAAPAGTQPGDSTRPESQSNKQTADRPHYASDGYRTGRSRMSARKHQHALPVINKPEDDLEGAEEVCTTSETDSKGAHMLVCLPSPNITGGDLLEPEFKLPGRGQLTASDLFANQQLVKRPSTILVQTDAINQVAQALKLAQTSAAEPLRSRRQAIVPPKLTTDAGGDSPQGEAQLIELDGSQQSEDQREDREEATRRALRRKRSGGSAGGRPHAVQSSPSSPERPLCVPQVCVEPIDEAGSSVVDSPDRESRATSSGSPGVGSPMDQAEGQSASWTPGSSSPLALAVPSAANGRRGSQSRRRSSIAVIPPMQICPGDLLVYSRQLIDRMNQSDENEPPPFLTIDDSKKGKSSNIWSSFKLCAQFDNRTLRARNELLCSLEDVLASLQPSTFVDEQLSHYKGMLWDEFLCETESRRSASSEALAEQATLLSEPSNLEQLSKMVVTVASPASPGDQQAHQQNIQKLPSAGESPARGSVKVTLSSGDAAGSPATGSPGRASPSGHQAPSLLARFKEKPKLKRGQTVDSVFRIPLIPSSPLKHAQQHQQTPTAHLEELPEPSQSMGTIEDDESVGEPERPRHRRSASTRLSAGRTDWPMKQQKQQQLSSQDQESSFETDDALDLLMGSQASLVAAQNGRPRNTIHRQSSLSTLSSTLTRTEQKRQRALWDLFQSECAFFFDHLMTLKNVYMEPLKKIQVEGFAMFADPDVLFGNLDELCCGVYDFCKEFLYIIMRTLKTRPEELNATDVLIKLYKKNPKIEHLRAVYHRYTLNYINALTYLESLRRQVEFVEFEKWSSRDVRCKKLQLTDLLVAPVQHIMRVPIILKDIESHTENQRDRDEIRAILAVEEASLRELDDKMRWLKNFERLLEIQKNISWPSVLELEPKSFIPEALRDVLARQPCEKLIVSPRRQIVHEGTLTSLDSGKACDMHVILFDDMLLLTRRKKGLTKRTSTVCKTNSGGNSLKDDGSFKYLVYKQPLSLDRFYVHDVQQLEAHALGMKHLFVLIVMNRFQQIVSVHSLSAPNDDIKQTWLFKIKKTVESWKKKNLTNTDERQQPQQELQPHQQLQQQTQSSQAHQSQQHQGHHHQPRSASANRDSVRTRGLSNSGSPKQTKPSSRARSTDRKESLRNMEKPVELVVTRPPNESNPGSPVSARLGA